MTNGPIAFRGKTQSVTSTSSTEAEFIAAVSAAKAVKYIHSILSDLQIPQEFPTPIHMDNISATKIINAKLPTERAHHIDIQFSAIQD
jgi:hypothetical protein